MEIVSFAPDTSGIYHWHWGGWWRPTIDIGRAAAMVYGLRHDVPWAACILLEHYVNISTYKGVRTKLFYIRRSSYKTFLHTKEFVQNFSTYRGVRTKLFYIQRSSYETSLHTKEFVRNFSTYHTNEFVRESINFQNHLGGGARAPRSEPSAGLCVERHTRRPASGPGAKLHGPT